MERWKVDDDMISTGSYENAKSANEVICNALLPFTIHNQERERERQGGERKLLFVSVPVSVFQFQWCEAGR